MRRAVQTPYVRRELYNRSRLFKGGNGMDKHQRLREWEQCAYCGQHDMLTVDHVIPRCLFDGVTGGVPGDVPRVGACRQCNNAKSTDDTFLRDVLVRDSRLVEHPIAQTIRHGAHARSIIRGKSQYPRAASRLRFVPSQTGSGLLVAEPILPKERLHGIFTRLVRGLMVAYEHYELPSITNFDVGVITFFRTVFPAKAPRSQNES